jgi:membrane-associated phospholipid phosphatase
MSGILLLTLAGAGLALPAQLPADARAKPGVKLYPPLVTEERSGGRPDMVLRWNWAALEAIRADATPPPVAARNLAMVHVAIYDAVNAIRRTHQVFRFPAVAAPAASPEAAAASAAHSVLVALYPRQRAYFDHVLRKSLAEVPPGPGRDDGMDLGRFVAGKVLAWRQDDGADRATGRYTPRPIPGVWRPTPVGFRPALLPQWGMVSPFAIRKGTQLRPLGPPALTSAAYTAAFREVKLLGGRDSKARTADQTQIAYFWADGAGTVTPPGHWNQLAQAVARQRGNTLAENARLFALLNVSLADAGILCWVIKFTHGFWRPVTAITQADEDGNPDTDPDPDWLPLLETPPFPAYTSGHSTFSGAAAAVLAHCFGTDHVAFEATSEGTPGVRRSYRGFWAAAEEAGQSRIYGGIHWQFDNMDGLAIGRHLGEYVCRNFLQPQGPTAAPPRDPLYRPLPPR